MKYSRIVLMLLMLCALHNALAQDKNIDAASGVDTDSREDVNSGTETNSGAVASQTADVDATKRLGVLQFGSKYISSLLKDKEIPILGGRWGGEVMIDSPLNGEPEDSRPVLRRAKVRYGRAFGDHWLAKLTANYTRAGGFEAADTYIVYSGWKTALLTFGVFDPPFSLESKSTSSSITFMERSLVVDALSERQSGGLAFLKRTPNHIFNGMFVFLNPKDNDLRQSGQAVIGHYVYSPIALEEADSVHMGGSFSYRQNTSSNSTQFRTLPEVATADNYFVDTGTIDGADKVIRMGLEASKVSGRFSWQSEVLATEVKRQGENKVYFWGAYAYVSWFLTDDSRNYDFGTGNFDVVTPNAPFLKGGWGAFEVAARLSHVDLTNKDLVGGTENNITLGLNWYLNEKIRFMTNLTKVLKVDHPGSEFDNQNPLIFSLRAQWLLR